MSTAAFSGHVVVFTGKLSSLSRREAQEVVRKLGGLPAEEVSGRTTMLVVGARGAAPLKQSGASEGDDGESAGATAAFGHGSHKLKKAQQISARTGQLEIVTEQEFCRRAGLPSPDTLRQQFYTVRDIRGMYANVREDHLRYLEKWGLIEPPLRTHTERYYGFRDLTVIKQASAELDMGGALRAVLRSLSAAQDGQLTFDFRPARSDAQPAKVIALQPRAPVALTKPQQEVSDNSFTLAAKLFLEASRLEDGSDIAEERAAALYRQALTLDPELVPALVNLANVHYARDELIEAQALYERALSIDINCFEAHFNLGNIFHDTGQYWDARACYRDAIALNPTYPEAHFYLAVTLEKMGLSIEAKPHWRKYQLLSPHGEWVELAKEFSD